MTWSIAVATLIAAACALLFSAQKSPSLYPVTKDLEVGQTQPSGKLESAPMTPINVVLPRPNTPTARVREQLEDAARAGSANAACRIAQETWRCASVDASLDLAETLVGIPGLPTPGRSGSLSQQLLNQAEAIQASCAGISERAISDSYTFQRIAATEGGDEFKRWLIAAPALRQDRFLDDLEEWKDYRERSEAYVKHSLQSRHAEDLPLLLSIYAPAYVQTLRPPYKADDNHTFLALMEVAKTRQLKVPPELVEAAERMMQNMAGPAAAVAHERAAQLSGGWIAVEQTQSLHELFVVQQSDEFCR